MLLINICMKRSYERTGKLYYTHPVYQRVKLLPNNLKGSKLCACVWHTLSFSLAVALCRAAVAGFDHLSAAGWRKLARAFPLLTILRLGGSASSSSAALKALPHILPGLLHPAAAAAAPVAAVAAGPPATAAAGMDGEQGGRQCTADCSACCSGSSNGAAEETAELEVLSSWEDAFQYDWELRADQQRKGSCCCGSPHVHAAEQQQQQQYRVSSRLQLLRVLVWPDVPDEAVQLVQQQCPRILINPAMVPDPATGHLPPAQVDPGVPLDAPWMQLAGPHALRVSTA